MRISDGSSNVCSSELGRPVFRDLRWGVYVTLAADSDYVRRCFKEYGLITDPTGNYAAMYKPYHLIGLELGISVASVGLRHEPTGSASGWHGDVVATAKRDLRSEEHTSELQSIMRISYAVFCSK